MPFTKSRAKSLRKAKVRTLRNKMIRTRMRNAVKKALQAFESGDRAVAEAALREAARQLDKSVSKGVIHKNQAARRKSRLTKRFKAIFEAAEQAD